ncbi:MAG: hypothetical protein AVDCRST_MAG62-1502 [uncultured Sphingomonas sp.]|uniref:beta-lactamase n=1 Tax=uncultured Sphingomonas sp. TaxID=158754 RepID=A0A6J4TN08_9SPHN|nr:MAG: hypothetical protein AVDCRST_MAG62-1502 [uncultured Sphingomonas sp.]
MKRRSMIALAAPMLCTGATRTATAEERYDIPDVGNLDMALRRFRALPGSPSYLLHIGERGSSGRFAHQPNLFLFIASAFKTFVLGQYLRDVETGRTSLDEHLPIDDGIRNFGSPVFLSLAGTTTARSVLEAMITHSDNMATDAAMLKVGADQVRALIAEAGLRSIRIPDTTRLFASYLFGAPRGTDLGWTGLQQILTDPPATFRAPLNDVITLAGTARDLVSWYEQALRGAFFERAETLREFKRIHAMAVQIARVAPPDTLVYAKGGEVQDLEGFNVKILAGQMAAGARLPVTFCFLTNWDSVDGAFTEVEEEFFAAIAGILHAVKGSVTAR